MSPAGLLKVGQHGRLCFCGLQFMIKQGFRQQAVPAEEGRTAGATGQPAEPGSRCRPAWQDPWFTSAKQNMLHRSG